MRTLFFIFKKNPRDSIPYLEGFKVESESPIRYLDSDKTSLTHHEELLSTEAISQQVRSNSWSSKKIMELQVSDELYTFYTDGHLTTTHDDLLGNESGETLEDPQPVSAPLLPNLGTNPADVSSTVNLILQHQQLMEGLVNAMTSLLDRTGSKQMMITKFDGSSEDAKTWMVMYERACEANRWSSDKLKVNNLKASFVPFSAADRWYSSRIIYQGDKSWQDWKQAFLNAFSQNRVQSATRALKYEYRFGPLMDYFFEKERLLQIAFSELGEHPFITLVILGLPAQLQGQILLMDPKTKIELHDCLQKLPATDRPRREQSQYNSNQPQTNVYQRKHETNIRQEQPHSNQLKKNPPQKTNDKKANKVNAVTENTAVNVVNHVKQEDGRELPVYSVNCNGVIVKALLDSGSNMNLINEALVNNNRWKTVPDIKTATTFNGKSITSKDKCNIRVSFSLLKPSGRKDVLIETQASIFKGISSDLILGYPFLLRAGIELSPIPVTPTSVDNNLPVNQQKVVSITGVESIFPGILRENYTPQYEVPFNLNDTSIVQCKPYRL